MNRLNQEVGNNTQMRAGIFAGFDFRIGKNGFLNPGVYFQEYTQPILYATLNEEEVTTNETDVQVRYLRAPVRLGFYFIDKKKFNLYSLVGVSAHIHLSTKEGEVDFMAEPMRPLFFGGELALGIDLNKFNLEVGYELGVTPMLVDLDKSQNNAVRASLGYLF